MYYAMSLRNVSNDVHVFATKSERDMWVDDWYETRVPLRAKDARRNVSFLGRAYTHGDAYVPVSWRPNQCWRSEPTCDPDVYETFDLVKRYRH